MPEFLFDSMCWRCVWGYRQYDQACTSQSHTDHWSDMTGWLAVDGRCVPPWSWTNCWFCCGASQKKMVHLSRQVSTGKWLCICWGHFRCGCIHYWQVDFHLMFCGMYQNINTLKTRQLDRVILAQNTVCYSM